MWIPATSFPKTVNLSKEGLHTSLQILSLFPVSHYLYICAVLQIFHRLTKHRTVHQLVEVRFKITFCLLVKLRVHTDGTRMELYFLQEFRFAKPFKWVHVLVRVDALLQQQPTLVSFWDHSMHDRKLITPLHQLVKAALLCRKFTLSTNLRFPSGNEIYFSVFVGMHFISPRTHAIACIRCPS